MWSSNHDRHLAVFFVRWRDSDLNVLAESGQEVKQAAHGKVAGPISRQRRHMWLRNTKNFPSFCLGEAALLDDVIDLQSQARLHQFLVGVGQPKICNNVSTAFGDSGILDGFSPGLHCAPRLTL